MLSSFCLSKVLYVYIYTVRQLAWWVYSKDLMCNNAVRDIKAVFVWMYSDSTYYTLAMEKSGEKIS